MIDIQEKNRFAFLCGLFCTPYREGIGTYNEKTLHRVLKNFVEENNELHEIKIGRYFADILRKNEIVEIQTGSFYPLKSKIEYYLKNTEYTIKIIYPVAVSKKIVRIDKESGEVLRSRMSPVKEKAQKILPELFWLSDFLCDKRLSFEIFEINITEYRYSDQRVRYRKSGAYESESFPTSLEEIHIFSSPADLLRLLPSELCESSEGFSAKEFSAKSGLRGRKAYSALNALCAAKVLKKEKNGSSTVFCRA